MRGSRWAVRRRRRKDRLPRRKRLLAEALEPRLMLSHDGDTDQLDIFEMPLDLEALVEEDAAAPGDVNVSPFPQVSYSTLANGMPNLNSLPSAPAAIYLDFDGGVYHGSFTADPYDVDGDSDTFNVEEQETIAEAWRHMSAYFAMFNVNVTTVQPNKPVAWLLVGNNISGGQSYVNVFPNSRPESRNASSHARTRVSALAHEIGHNFGNQHTANYDDLGVKIDEYHDAFDPLHGPIMGLDYTGVIHKWTTWHSRNGATVLQDDMAVIAADLDNYGGDGYRADDVGGTIPAAAPLTAIGTTQAKVGIIERLTDVDMYSFISDGGTYSILVGRDNPSGVDVKVSVLDAVGTVLAAEDGDPRKVPYTMVNDSHITLALPAGTFYVKVENHGNYGDQGQYIVRVDPLAASWQAEDVGLNGVPGYSSYDAASGVYTVAGSGTDIAGSADGFQYLYQRLEGSGTITVRVESLDNTSSAAKVGIMIRDSLAENARNVALVITPSSGVQWSSRSAVGGGTSSTTVGGAFAPTWLRISRSGSTFTAYKSNDGVVWTQVGSPRTVSMGTTVYIGQVASAKNNIRLSTATLSNVSLTGTLNPSLLLTDLPAPAALAAPSISSTSVSLVWDAVALAGDTNGDSSVGVDDYYNVRDHFGQSGLGDANDDGLVDEADFRLVKDHLGDHVLSYSVERATDGVNFTAIGTTAANTTVFVDSGLSDFQRYTYRVRARNSYGYSPPSTVVVATTHAGAVTNLNLISYSSSQLIPDWTDASGEVNYRVERSNDGVSGWTTRATVSKNVPTINDSGLAANTRYFYRVLTLESGGVVAATSAVVSAFTRLPTVTGLAFLSEAANQLKIGWNAVTGAASYRVERSTDGDSFSTVASGVLVTNFTDNSVSPSTEYFYRVVGVNQNTSSVPSSEISTTTPASAAGGEEPGSAASSALDFADVPSTAADLSRLAAVSARSPRHGAAHSPGWDIVQRAQAIAAGRAADRALATDHIGPEHLGRIAKVDRPAPVVSSGEQATTRAAATERQRHAAVDAAVASHEFDVRPEPRWDEPLLAWIARHDRDRAARPGWQASLGLDLSSPSKV